MYAKKETRNFTQLLKPMFAYSVDVLLKMMLRKFFSERVRVHAQNLRRKWSSLRNYQRNQPAINHKKFHL